MASNITNRAGLVSFNTPSSPVEELKSPDEVRTYLTKVCVLPTPEKAKETYWSLGMNNWWKQILDGNLHKHGCMVFDEGLHRGHIEPGYLKGVERASHFFADNFHQPFSLELYKEIHSRACAHFAHNTKDKTESGIICPPSKINSFRTAGERCGGLSICDTEFAHLEKVKNALSGISSQLRWAQEDVENHGKVNSDDEYFAELLDNPMDNDLGTKQRKLNVAVLKAQKILAALSYDNIPDDPKTLCSILDNKEREIWPKLKQIGKTRVQQINDLFQEISSRLGLKTPFVYCILGGDITICISYEAESASLKFGELAETLIAEFDQNLTRLQKETCDKVQSADQEITQIKEEYQEQALFLIARLYAELEWAHPWIDGQGRTDLIALNGLLCQAGLHPCILEEPYFSTGALVPEWVDYLKAGLKKFEEVRGF
ncbi:MAG TPA: Fic family protein [Rhabdochlamydiaceae bacterium]